jgi:hypothetical protein
MLNPNKIHTKAFDIAQFHLSYKDAVNYKDTKLQLFDGS